MTHTSISRSTGRASRTSDKDKAYTIAKAQRHNLRRVYCPAFGCLESFTDDAKYRAHYRDTHLDKGKHGA